jgi:hypothetical protein
MNSYQGIDPAVISSSLQKDVVAEGRAIPERGSGVDGVW